MSSNIRQVEATAKKLADAALGAEERELAERLVSALEAQNEALLSKFIQARSQTGRDLNNLKILAHASMDPVTWRVKAKRTSGRDLTDAERAEINRLTREGDRAGLVKFVASLRKATFGGEARDVLL